MVPGPGLSSTRRTGTSNVSTRGHLQLWNPTRQDPKDPEDEGSGPRRDWDISGDDPDQHTGVHLDFTGVNVLGLIPC